MATPDGFGGFSRAELSAISGVVAYVEKTQKARAAAAVAARSARRAASTLFIDPATRANLELVRTLSGSRDGSLFKAIDRTVTGAGARLLAERLTSPLTDPGAIGRRLDSVAFLVADRRLRDALRARAEGRRRHAAGADAAGAQPRRSARSRRAARRPCGGRPDRGACWRSAPPAEIAAALRRDRGAAAGFRWRISSGALADELPLLKRDGGFVRAGYDAELDEMRALRDQSRRVIAGMERDLIEETGIRSLKIRHNNVLGYYIEVTANHQAIMNGSAEAKARFIHRQTMASAMRFTTTELAELETKIANAADRALAIELGVFDRLVGRSGRHADAIRAGARRWPCSTCRQRWPRLPDRELRPADRRRQPGLRDRGRPPSGRRAGAAAAPAEALRRQ